MGLSGFFTPEIFLGKNRGKGGGIIGV